MSVRPFQILLQLWPNSGRKLMYLANVAVLTRLATGITRVLENRPSKQNNTQLTEVEKKQAVVERSFVEIVGTISYMICLHLGQDVVDLMANHLSKNATFLKDIQNESFKGHQVFKNAAKKLGLKIDTLETHLKKAVEEVYGHPGQHHNLVYRTLYEHELEGLEQTGQVKAGKAPFGKSTMGTVKTRLAEKLESELSQPNPAFRQELDKQFQKLVNEISPLKKFAQRNNKLAILGILVGVASSALVGGSLTQWLNDRVVAPTAKRFLTRREALKKLKNNKPSVLDSVNQLNASLPASSNSTALLSPEKAANFRKPVSFLSAAPVIAPTATLAVTPNTLSPVMPGTLPNTAAPRFGYQIAPWPYQPIRWGGQA